MERDPESAPAAYLNRPPGHMAVWRTGVENFSRHHTAGRAVDRLFLALRVYEQRAQRRAALRAWMTARRSAAAPQAVGHLAVPDAASG